MNNIPLCTFAKQPDKNECREAIVSQGKACKTCEIKCYRQGWDEGAVSRDNKRLCEGKER